MLTEDEIAIMCASTSFFLPQNSLRPRLISNADSVHAFDDDRETSRDYCQEKLKPRVVEAYRNESESLLVWLAVQDGRGN